MSYLQNVYINWLKTYWTHLDVAKISISEHFGTSSAREQSSALSLTLLFPPPSLPPYFPSPTYAHAPNTMQVKEITSAGPVVPNQNNNYLGVWKKQQDGFIKVIHQFCPGL